MAGNKTGVNTGKTLHAWELCMNPLRGLTKPQIDSMLQQARCGNDARLQVAFQELERAGLVFSQRSSGRYVTEDVEIIMEAKKAMARQYVQSFMKSMEQLGYTGEEILRLLEEGEKEEKQ